MAAPSTSPKAQEMGANDTMPVSAIKGLYGKARGRLPKASNMMSPEMKRWAFFCCNASCCYWSDEGVFGCSEEEQCLCSKFALSCVFCKFCEKGPNGTASWATVLGGCQCCDQREEPCTCAACGCDFIEYCCIKGTAGGMCDLQKACDPFILCKYRGNCCCIYSGFSIPCDEDIPMELGACGIMCIDKSGDAPKPAGNEPAAK